MASVTQHEPIIWGAPNTHTVSPLLRAPMVIIHSSKAKKKKEWIFFHTFTKMYHILEVAQGECAHGRGEKAFIENSVRKSYSWIIHPGVLYTS